MKISKLFKYTFSVFALLAMVLTILPLTSANAAGKDPYAEIYSKVLVDGTMLQIGNTLLTCDGSSTSCINARNYTVDPAFPQFQALGNDNFMMKAIDIDTTDTWNNSTSADLIIPTGYQLTDAFLFWGGSYGGGLDSADCRNSQSITNCGTAGTQYANLAGGKEKNAKFKVGTGAYNNVVADASYHLDSQARGYFSSWKKITSQLGAASTAGTYPITVSSEVTSDGWLGGFNGWSLLTVIEKTKTPQDCTVTAKPELRNISIMDGFVLTSDTGADTTDAKTVVQFDVTGFKVPTSIPNAANGSKLFMAVVDGDADYNLDTYTFGPTGTEFNLQRPIDNKNEGVVNPFRSLIDTGADSNRQPAISSGINTFGLDLLNFDTGTFGSQILPNGATSLTNKLTAGIGGDADRYAPLYFAAEIPAVSPSVCIIKSAIPAPLETDTASQVKTGDVIEYTLNHISNGSGDASNALTTDSIPTGTEYIPGSLTIDGAPQTDASGDDLASYNATTNRVTYSAPIAPKGTERIYKFKVKVLDTALSIADKTVRNQALSSYRNPDFPTRSVEIISNEVSHPVQPGTPNVTIVKSAVTPAAGTTVKNGDLITYQLDIENTGTGAASNVLVTDNIPTGTTYQASSLKANTIAQTDAVDTDNASFASAAVSFKPTGGNLATAAKESYQFSVTVTDDKIVSKEISNVASLTYTDPSNPNTPITVPSNPIKHPLVPVGIIGDKVFEDQNGNGIQDPTEPGIAGVKVDVKDSAGNVIATTTTDANGIYSVSVPAGTYTLVFTPPAGAVPTQSGKGTADTDSNINTSSTTGPITVAAGETNKTIDAGYVYAPVVTIVKSSNPAALSQVKVGDTITYSLTVSNTGKGKALNVSVDDKVPAGTTYVAGSADNSGILTGDTIDWMLGDLAPGATKVLTFKVTVIANTLTQIVNTANVKYTDPTKPNAPVTTPSNPVVHPLGTPAIIGDKVFEDQNGDGIQGPTKPGIAGVKVDVKDSAGNIIATTTTDANGIYSVSVPAGTYTLVFTPPAGAVPTQSGKGTADTDSNINTSSTTGPITVAAGETNKTIDAGYVYAPVVTIVKSSNPAALSQVKVGDTITYSLTVSNTGKGKALNVSVDDKVPAGTTYVAGSADNSGILTGDTIDWMLGDLAPAASKVLTFKVTVVANTLTEIVNTANVKYTDPTKPTTPVTTPSNTIKHPLAATIGNFIWNDKNGNGIQDAGEPGVPGVKVTLKDPAGKVICETTTDASGFYSCTVPAGTYTPTFTLPAGTYPTKNGQGTSATDSDILPNLSGNPITVTNGQVYQDLDGGIVYAPMIKLTKSSTPAAGSTVAYGDVITYNIEVKNEGTGSSFNQMVMDTIPTGTEYVTASADNSGSYIATSNSLTWMLGTIEPSASKIVSFKVKVTGADNLSEIKNVATETHDDPANPGKSTPPTSSNEIKHPLVACLGDYIWNDKNGNGIQDAGEKGLAGITVSILDASGKVVSTTKTDANGKYGFCVPAGEYKVQVIVPKEYVPTKPGQGTPDTDSKIDLGGLTPVIKLTPGQKLTNIDAGLEPLPPVANPLTKYTQVNTPVNYNPLINDTHPSGLPFELCEINGVAVKKGDLVKVENGSIKIEQDGTITFIPNQGWTGTQKFKYTICDINGKKSTTEDTIIIPTPVTPRTGGNSSMINISMLLLSAYLIVAANKSRKIAK